MLTVADLLRGPRAASQVDEDPLAHLSACHRRVEHRLATLARAVEAYPHDPAAALQAMDGALWFFATSGIHHTVDEEASVFPRLLARLPAAADRAILEALENEHGEAAALHEELDALVAAARAGAPDLAALKTCLQRLTALYTRHIALEDSRVAELARQHLTAEEWSAIGGEMKTRRRSPGKLVVVGGHSRHVGKTRMVKAILDACPELHWHAVKISSHHRHAGLPHPGHPTPHLLRLTDEEFSGGLTGLTALRNAGRNLLVESNRIVAHLNPDLVIFVINPLNPDWKASSAACLRRASALVYSQDGAVPPLVAECTAEALPAFRLHADEAVPRHFVDWLRAQPLTA